LYKTKSIGQASLTPGSILMIELKEKIKNWAEEKYKKGLFKDDLSFFISGSDEVGEGEIKILNHISSLKEQRRESYGIISPDSDIILMALSCLSKENILVLAPTRSGKSFLCISKVRFLEHFNEIIPSKACNSFITNAVDEMCLDFVLISLLKGNDYIPGVSRWTKFHVVYQNYIHLKKNNQSLLQYSTNKKWTLNLETLSKIHSKEPKAPDSMKYDKTKKYLTALMWNFEMYASCGCTDYKQENVENISLSDVISLVKQNNSSKSSNIFEYSNLYPSEHPLNHYLFSFCLLPKPCFVYFPKDVLEVMTPELEKVLEECYYGEFDLELILKEAKDSFSKFPTSTSLLLKKGDWKNCAKMKPNSFFKFFQFEYAKSKSFHQLAPKKPHEKKPDNVPIKIDEIPDNTPIKQEVKVPIKQEETSKPPLKTGEFNIEATPFVPSSLMFKSTKILLNKPKLNPNSKWKKEPKEEKKEIEMKSEKEVILEVNKFQKKEFPKKPKRVFKFHLNDDPSCPIAAAGCLIYKIVNDEILVLLIENSWAIEDLGGMFDAEDESIFVTASREAEEESNGAIKASAIMDRLKTSETLYIKDGKYLIFFVQATKEEELLKKQDFGFVEKTDNIERTIDWVPLTKWNLRKLHQRLHYQPILNTFQKIFPEMKMEGKLQDRKVQDSPSKSRKKAKFFFNEDPELPITAAGALIYKIVDGKLFLLMINKLQARRYSHEDIGGKVDEEDETIFHSASREIEEETNKVIPSTSIMDRLKSSECFHNKNSKYLIFFVKATKEEESLKKEDFGSGEDVDFILRTIDWISIEDYTTLYFKRKFNPRLSDKRILKIIEKLK
jgi:ADP-ribose pyrophosphatase YjhB (NUDIX family)